jgi:hypothetical protein
MSSQVKVAASVIAARVAYKASGSPICAIRKRRRNKSKRNCVGPDSGGGEGSGRRKAGHP